MENRAKDILAMIVVFGMFVAIILIGFLFSGSL